MAEMQPPSWLRPGHVFQKVPVMEQREVKLQPVLTLGLW